MIIEVSGNWTTLCLITTYCSYFEIAEFSQYQLFHWSKSQFVEKLKQKSFYNSFCIRDRNDAIYRTKMVPFKTKWCDLEQKIVLFVKKTHCWEPIGLRGSPMISENGYYKSEEEAACRALQLATCTSSILIYLICPQNYRISIVFSFP